MPVFGARCNGPAELIFDGVRLGWTDAGGVNVRLIKPRQEFPTDAFGPNVPVETILLGGTAFLSYRLVEWDQAVLEKMFKLLSQDTVRLGEFDNPDDDLLGRIGRVGTCAVVRNVYRPLIAKAPLNPRGDDGILSFQGAGPWRFSKTILTDSHDVTNLAGDAIAWNIIMFCIPDVDRGETLGDAEKIDDFNPILWQHKLGA